MDPNQALKDALDAAWEIINESNDSPTTAHELAEALTALDMWIVKGGFLPSRWKPEVAA